MQFSHACDVISQVNQARLSVAGTTELHGTLHIGTIESLTCLKMPAVLHRYRQHHPKVSIHITVGVEGELSSFFICGKAWGVYSQKKENGEMCKHIDVLYGTLDDIQVQK